MLWHKIKINKSSFKSVASDFKSNVEKYFRILFYDWGLKFLRKLNKYNKRKKIRRFFPFYYFGRRYEINIYAYIYIYL